MWRSLNHWLRPLRHWCSCLHWSLSLASHVLSSTWREHHLTTLLLPGTRAALAVHTFLQWHKRRLQTQTIGPPRALDAINTYHVMVAPTRSFLLIRLDVLLPSSCTTFLFLAVDQVPPHAVEQGQIPRIIPRTKQPTCLPGRWCMYRWSCPSKWLQGRTRQFTTRSNRLLMRSCGWLFSSRPRVIHIARRSPTSCPTGLLWLRPCLKICGRIKRC